MPNRDTQIFKSINDVVKQTIEQKKTNTRKVLQEAEETFVRNMQSHITHHKYLLDVALTEKKTERIAYHRLMVETYESILSNYSYASEKV